MSAEIRAAERVLAGAVEAFLPGRLALVSAFGPGSAVLLDMLSRIAPELPVIFIDTLHHFPETLLHVAWVRRRYDLDLRVYRPAASRRAFEARYGTRLWERDLELYQHVTKVRPFRRATADLDAWITGRRRDQAATRAELRVIEEGQQVRINPLAAWSRADVWRYIVERALPYNPLHDRGYPSVGDEPLTAPLPRSAAGDARALIRAHIDERAGRWPGSDRVECGIHTRDEQVQ